MRRRSARHIARSWRLKPDEDHALVLGPDEHRLRRGDHWNSGGRLSQGRRSGPTHQVPWVDRPKDVQARRVHGKAGPTGRVYDQRLAQAPASGPRGPRHWRAHLGRCADARRQRCSLRHQHASLVDLGRHSLRRGWSGAGQRRRSGSRGVSIRALHDWRPSSEVRARQGDPAHHRGSEQGAARADGHWTECRRGHLHRSRSRQ